MLEMEMTDTKPTLEAQIEWAEVLIKWDSGIAPAVLASLKELAAIKEQVAQLIIKHAFATGHGDTASDMLLELDAQLTERYRSHPVPVAWMYQERDGKPFASMNHPASFDKNELSENEVTVTPLYTAPQSRR